MLNNFWTLINEYKIEIPVIQRDYAQGRKGQKEIRENFVDSIFNSLEKNENLNLDFIYGHIEDDKFIPLDGQQRLTTLYLVYIYLGLFIKEEYDEYYKVLKNFTYETRESSRKFCEAITDNIRAIKLMDTNIVDSIRNSNWYFTIWDNDPTILSMLNMLKAIENRAENTYKGDLEEKLIKKPTIFFNFMDIEETYRDEKYDYGAKEDLYIKMNARGRQLSEFENLKSKLIETLPADWIDRDKRSFMEKMDIDWTDIFWNYKKSDISREKEYDAYFMEFIRVILINKKIRKLKKDDLKGLSIDDLKLWTYYDFKDGDVIDREFYEELTSMLNYISEYEIYIEHNKNDDRRKFYSIEEEVFSKVIEGDSTYEDLGIFYAITRYNYYNSTERYKKNYTQWLRVVHNLVKNTLINTAVEFKEMIISLDQILIETKDIESNYILDYLVTVKDRRFKGLEISQLSEEIFKSNLLTIDENWMDIINILDGDSYFEGQTGFLFQFAEILEDDIKTKEKEEKVSDYYLFISEIFNEAIGQEVNINLFIRALLTYGDKDNNYMIEVGKNHSFATKYQRDTSFKRILKFEYADKNRNKDKGKYIKELLDDILKYNDMNINNILEDIIIERVIDISDWRRYFIEHEEIISIYGGSGDITYRKEYRYIRKNSEDIILILNSSRTSGLCTEYYSYSLYIMLCRIYGNDNLSYIDSAGERKMKYISLNLKDKNYIIFNDYDNFILMTYDRVKLEESQRIEYMDRLDIVKEIGDDKTIRRFSSIDGVISYLERR